MTKKKYLSVSTFNANFIIINIMLQKNTPRGVFYNTVGVITLQLLSFDDSNLQMQRHKQ